MRPELVVCPTLAVVQADELTSIRATSDGIFAMSVSVPLLKPRVRCCMGVSHLLHTKQPSHLRAFLDKLGNVKGEVLDRLIDLNVVLPGGGRPDAGVAFLKPSQQPHP